MLQVNFLSADWQIFVLAENLDAPIYITPHQMKEKKKKNPARDVNLISHSLSLFSQSRPTMFLTAVRAPRE